MGWVIFLSGWVDHIDDRVRGLTVCIDHDHASCTETNKWGLRGASQRKSPPAQVSTVQSRLWHYGKKPARCGATHVAVVALIYIPFIST